MNTLIHETQPRYNHQSLMVDDHPSYQIDHFMGNATNGRSLINPYSQTQTAASTHLSHSVNRESLLNQDYVGTGG